MSTIKRSRSSHNLLLTRTKSKSAKRSKVVSDEASSEDENDNKSRDSMEANQLKESKHRLELDPNVKSMICRKCDQKCYDMVVSRSVTGIGLIGCHTCGKCADCKCTCFDSCRHEGGGSCFYDTDVTDCCAQMCHEKSHCQCLSTCHGVPWNSVPRTVCCGVSSTVKPSIDNVDHVVSDKDNCDKELKSSKSKVLDNKKVNKKSEKSERRFDLDPKVESMICCSCSRVCYNMKVPRDVTDIGLIGCGSCGRCADCNCTCDGMDGTCQAKMCNNDASVMECCAQRCAESDHCYCLSACAGVPWNSIPRLDCCGSAPRESPVISSESDKVTKKSKKSKKKNVGGDHKKPKLKPKPKPEPEPVPNMRVKDKDEKKKQTKTLVKREEPKECNASECESFGSSKCEMCKRSFCETHIDDTDDDFPICFTCLDEHEKEAEAEDEKNVDDGKSSDSDGANELDHHHDDEDLGKDKKDKKLNKSRTQIASQSQKSKVPNKADEADTCSYCHRTTDDEILTKCANCDAFMCTLHGISSPKTGQLICKAIACNRTVSIC